MNRVVRWTSAAAALALVTCLATPLFASPVIDGGDQNAGADDLSIGDFIWSDTNGNGCQDPGEPGVPGVVVDLVQNGVYLQEVITDQNGHYIFTGLYSGTYRVEIKPPCPLTKTHACSSALDSDTNPVYVTLQYDDNLTIDFGLTCPPVQNSCNCTLNYPDHSNDPRSSVVFNESTVLRAYEPGAQQCAVTGGKIKLWYNDEHALTLGVRRVIVKNPGGSTTTTDYAIAPTPASPTGVTNPAVGSQVASGAQAGNDVAAGGGRPLWPALFITDLTLNGPNSRAGDWQQGGTGTKPSAVYGTWKGAVRTVDNTHNPPTVTVLCDKDPAKNNWNLGAGSDVPTGGFSKYKNEGYGAEVVWNIADLNLDPSHSYRLQFMVHDGDQNKGGGDVGQACTVLQAVPQLVIGPSDFAQAQAAIALKAPVSAFAQSKATPNPFRETVRFSYQVSGTQRVDIGVFDVAGRKVRGLVETEQPAGSYSTQWDGRGDDGSQMTRGVYFLHAKVGGEQQTTRIMYLK